MSLSQQWLDFCKRGKCLASRQRESVNRSVAADGTVRGYYSDLLLNPDLDPTHSLYPSHDHTSHPRDDREMVVDARVINDMKTHLSEPEFWRMIEHLYAVGICKGKIQPGVARRHDSDWCPERHYSK
jgi:hypothetical protein